MIRSEIEVEMIYRISTLRTCSLPATETNDVGLRINTFDLSSLGAKRRPASIQLMNAIPLKEDNKKKVLGKCYQSLTYYYLEVLLSSCIKYEGNGRK